MATGPVPDNTDRLTASSSGSLKPQHYVEELPASLILAFLPWPWPVPDPGTVHQKDS